MQSPPPYPPRRNCVGEAPPHPPVGDWDPNAAKTIPVNEEDNQAPHPTHRSDRDDTISYGKFLDTPDRRGDRHRFYSRSGSDMYHGRHHYHPYRRSDQG